MDQEGALPAQGRYPSQAQGSGAVPWSRGHLVHFFLGSITLNSQAQMMCFLRGEKVFSFAFCQGGDLKVILAPPDLLPLNTFLKV